MQIFIIWETLGGGCSIVAQGVFYYPPPDSLTRPPWHHLNEIKKISLPLHMARPPAECSSPVKCNDSPIITLQRLLTTTYSMLHYKHNQRSWMSNNKPYQYTSHTPMQVSMPESLYAVVYSETAFRGLTQHPSHFHTISAAKAFVDQYCKPYNQSAYIIQVPVVASSIQS